MSKERFLTVYVPIRESDCEATVYASLAALQSAVPASASNVDKIYAVTGGTYYRSAKGIGDAYSYQAVVDREFPSIGNPIEIYDFTYDATRMGQAPTISAQGVMWYAEKDGNGNDVTLEGYWTMECHVKFNGENFYLKRIPTSSKTNEDARYRYDMDFVSERVILENVYLYDVVQPFITEKPISESATFSFYGDITELAKRINASLIRSGLASLVRKYVPYPTVPSQTVPYLTYEQWNQMNVNTSVLIGQGKPFSTAGEMQVFGNTIYAPLHGDYNAYLIAYIYESVGTEFVVNGYKVVIGKDKKGEDAVSDEKLVSFDKNTVYEALQQFHDTFELEYYVTREKDGNGYYTGNTLIVVGDCEHDFADWDDQNEDYVRDEEGIPTTSSPFDYGSADALLSKEKTNTTDKIVTRITGVGSTENIPWHYPNPNPDGWIKPIFKRGGIVQNDVTIEYPTDEGSTVAESVTYEKFLKNRIGAPIKRGAVKIAKSGISTSYNNTNGIGESGGAKFVSVKYLLDTTDIVNAWLTLDMSFLDGSNCNRFAAGLSRGNTVVGDYDSSQTYENPTSFQKVMASHDGKEKMVLATGFKYRLEFLFFLTSVPLSTKYSFEGYRYPSTDIEVPISTGIGMTVHIGENFYDEQNLQPFVDYNYFSGAINNVGYSTDGTAANEVVPIPRWAGKTYRDLSDGTIYRCYDTSQCNGSSSDHQNAFSANATVDWKEWISTYLRMQILVYSNDGWYVGYNKIYLEDYGLGNPMSGGSQVECGIFDEIAFQRVKYVTPQQNLMPEVYIKTDGERRYYNAHDYWDKENETLYEGTADTAIGEVQDGSYVKNPIYKENVTDADSAHYDFENEYIQQLPHEHIEAIDDVKPSIKEQTNMVDGNVIRIDVVEEFAYDTTDNDEIWESNGESGESGEYKHPYFFAKLRPLGFNIFDLALQEDMVLSMTTGHCGACNFKIGVDENTKKNPLQLWPYDVYDGDDLQNATKLYKVGELRRYVDTRGLYYDVDGEAVQVDGGGPETDGTYKTYTYSADEVADGFVGSMKKGGNVHFEGDVVTSGRYIDSLQDTSENYVWVALMKDTDAYGTIMPSARPDYNNPTYDRYIHPLSIADVHVEADAQNNISESTNSEDEEKADKFVLTNIRLPQMYLRRAERELSRRLVAYMYDNNYQKFNFSIRFSRIYMAQNATVDDDLNENSVLYVNFNNRTYRQYAKHYTYRMTSGEPLPEITVDMNEELSVSRTLTQQQAYYKQVNNRWLLSQMGAMTSQMQERIGKTTVSKTGSTVIYGDIVLKDAGTSLTEISHESAAAVAATEVIQTEISTGEVGGSLEWEEF